MSDRRKILILSANPKGTSPLRLGEEVREIKEGLRRAESRDQFIIETAEAVRYGDIQRALLDIKPQIVHFSGHGTGSQGRGLEPDSDRKLSPVPEDTAEPEGLVFEDEAGHVKLVDAEALAGLFELFTEPEECVEPVECDVLNACYSQVQAQAIARHIPYVIGMKKAIGDQAAIKFAVGFYDALGAGKSYNFAYKLGCNAIQLAGIAEEDIPMLFKAVQIDVTKGEQEQTAIPQPQPIGKLEYPTGCVSLDCPFYIERKEDALCYQEVEKAAALLQVKAPRQMGKSSLILRVENQAKKQGSDTAWIDFQLSDKERDLESLEKFLKWFCLSVTKKVGLSSQLL